MTDRKTITLTVDEWLAIIGAIHDSALMEEHAASNQAAQGLEADAVADFQKARELHDLETRLKGELA